MILCILVSARCFSCTKEIRPLHMNTGNMHPTVLLAQSLLIFQKTFLCFEAFFIIFEEWISLCRWVQSSRENGFREDGSDWTQTGIGFRHSEERIQTVS